MYKLIIGLAVLGLATPLAAGSRIPASAARPTSPQISLADQPATPPTSPLTATQAAVPQPVAYQALPAASPVSAASPDSGLKVVAADLPAQPSPVAPASTILEPTPSPNPDQALRIQDPLPPQDLDAIPSGDQGPVVITNPDPIPADYAGPVVVTNRDPFPRDH